MTTLYVQICETNSDPMLYELARIILCRTNIIDLPYDEVKEDGFFETDLALAKKAIKKLNAKGIKAEIV